MRHCFALVVLTFISLFTFPGRAPAQVPPATLTLSALQTGVPAARFFGQAIASNGQYLAIGAPYYFGAGGGTSAGVVVVFQRNGASWSLLNFVQAPAPVAGDGFGYHVTFSGQQLLVSAPFASVSGTNQRGVVYAYNIIAGFYAHTQTINPGAAVAAGGWFGLHSSADADWLAIGAPIAGTSQVGQVQLYHYDSNLEQWIYHSVLNGAVSGGRHGIRVLVRGDRILAAATEEAANISTRGWLTEYQRTGSGVTATWAQVQRFRQTGGAISVFGSAIALSPNASTLVVGAPYELDAGLTTQTGAVFVFNRNGSGLWTQSARIDPPSIAAGENFGTSLAFSTENDIVVGDIREGATTQLGAAHRYHRNTPGTWVKSASWQRGSGAAQDFMGVSVLAIGDDLVIGASGIDNGNTLDEGRVFVFNNALPLFRDGME